MGRLEDRLECLYRNRRKLFSIHLDVTWRCPLDCLHCYLSDKGGDEMSGREIEELLDQAAAMGVFTIGFSGGEVFARSDFLDLLAYARKHRFEIRVKTSGAFVPSAEIDSLIKLAPNLVDVSFYSHVAATHDAVTGRPGSFDSSLRTVLALQSGGVLAQAAVTLLRGYGDDARTIRAGLEALGIAHVGFNEVDDSCNARTRMEDLCPTDEHLARQFALNAPDAEPVDRPGDDSPVCAAGSASVHIAPDGTVRPCVLVDGVAGNVRSERIETLWNESAVLKDFRAMTWGAVEKCRACELRAWCRYCPARAARLTGNPLIPPGEFCRLARLRRGAA